MIWLAVENNKSIGLVIMCECGAHFYGDDISKAFMSFWAHLGHSHEGVFLNDDL